MRSNSASIATNQVLFWDLLLCSTPRRSIREMFRGQLTEHTAFFEPKNKWSAITASSPPFAIRRQDTSRHISVSQEGSTRHNRNKRSTRVSSKSARKNSQLLRMGQDKISSGEASRRLSTLVFRHNFTTFVTHLHGKENTEMVPGLHAARPKKFGNAKAFVQCVYFYRLPCLVLSSCSSSSTGKPHLLQSGRSNGALVPA